MFAQKGSVLLGAYGISFHCTARTNNTHISLTE